MVLRSMSEGKNPQMASPTMAQNRTAQACPDLSVSSELKNFDENSNTGRWLKSFSECVLALDDVYQINRVSLLINTIVVVMAGSHTIVLQVAPFAEEFGNEKWEALIGDYRKKSIGTRILSALPGEMLEVIKNEALAAISRVGMYKFNGISHYSTYMKSQISKDYD